MTDIDVPSPAHTVNGEHHRGSTEPAPSARVAELLDRMTLEEKLAQIVGLWVGAGSDGNAVAPMQDAMLGAAEFTEFAEHGLGHLTRVFGTQPVEPETGRTALHRMQQWLVDNTRLGIPAIAHEECLTGLAAWRAATFPTPLAWGASFDPELVQEMATAIGESMAALGVHQGLSPVLDVVRDPRWGRVEECISEDPYLVGTLGTQYVRGLQSAGIHATLKHLVGYSASVAGRNLAPVSAGPRELADVLLPPFEMAIKDGGARSVMHAYNDIDGVPVAADPAILTELLRDQWGFDGSVVADYFGVAFLHNLHGVAADLGEAAEMALAAGIDIELPTGNAYLEPLRERVESGQTPIELVDRAVLRVLRVKEELGLLDADFSGPAPTGDLDLDSPAHRDIARRLAERSVVLLSNDGTLPLRPQAKLAVVGPNANRTAALFGCYSFVNHVIPQHPGTEDGIVAPTVAEALGESFTVTYAEGCRVDDDDRSRIPEAVAAARDAEVAVVVVGDQSGLFGRGTVGEGCDRDDLELPGVQRELVEAVLETGTPVVLVLLTGRPYAIGWALDRCAAVVQAFFPGEEGATAIANVLSGEVNPSGRLPVSIPRSQGAQPYTYLHPPLAGPTETSNLDPTPPLRFGHGLSYTTFVHEDLTAASTEVPTDGTIELTVRVRNTGERAGSDVVQLYARDVAASVTRPVAQLLGYQRVDLAAGGETLVRFSVPTARLAFSNRAMEKVVEPGAIDLWVGPDCAERETETRIQLTGLVHMLDADAPRWTTSIVG